MGSTLSGRSNAFESSEIEDLRNQPFATKVGAFTTTEYKVSGNMGVNGTSVLNSELFFESIPDSFVDVPLSLWKYSEGSKEVPVILPRSYIAMYNFGFAQSHSLPRISDGLVGMIDLKIFVQGNGHKDEYKGKVIGFSSRLNTLLVPQAFMDWSNQYYAPNEHSDPTRLILQIDNPANEKFSQYTEKKGIEIENDKLNSQKTTYFLRMMVSMVMVVGLVISILSFYILMLSIYLLVQKNSSKLENLLLIGYSPNNVARPYQLLTMFLNVGVLLLAWTILYFIRDYYMGFIETLFPDIDKGNVLPAVVLGVALFLLVSICNLLAIRHKITRIWKRKE